jgi:hypothetical protein
MHTSPRRGGVSLSRTVEAKSGEGTIFYKNETAVTG